jgi:hypothetical protein
MKHILFFMAVLCLSFTTLQSQTNTWIGAGANTNWNTIANWSLNAVPTASNDVVIPTGFTVTLNVVGNTNSIEVQGNTTLVIDNALYFSAPSSFGANTTINWTDGSLRGGGTITNYGTINLETTSSKYIYDFTVLTNEGTMNFNSNGQFYLSNGTITNTLNGVIDMRAANGNITYTGGTVRVLNNFGLIKRTTTTGAASIEAELDNDGGTLSIESGSLVLSNNLIQLTNGIYNVATDASLNWVNTVTLEGVLTGTVDGIINWNSIVNVPTTASFNFTGASGVYWNNGSLNGGGALTNNSVITHKTTASRYIYDDTVLNNEALMTIEGACQFYITNGIVNNQEDGIIDMQADNGNITYTGGALHILNNYGLIRRTTSTGIASIAAELHNLGGTVSVESGTLNFVTLPKYLTGGIYNVSTGSFLTLTTQVFCADTLTGILDGELVWSNEINIPSTTSAIFDFTGVSGINWNVGNLRGSGTLVNKSAINITTTSSKYLYDDTVLTNEGTINIQGAGQLYVTDGIINNQETGVIDMQVDNGNITYTGGSLHELNNYGLIRRTTSTGIASIAAELNNLGGTLSVESGTLNFSSLPKYLTGGIYNIAIGSALTINVQTFCFDTLTGVLDGEIRWINEINVPAAATFDFTGTAGINWSNGNLSGSGTLINKGNITITTTASKYIYDDTVLSNEGYLNLVGTGQLYVTLITKLLELLI